jgi:hypothetical protein
VSLLPVGADRVHANKHSVILRDGKERQGKKQGFCTHTVLYVMDLVRCEGTVLKWQCGGGTAESEMSGNILPGRLELERDANMNLWLLSDRRDFAASV